MNEYSLSLSAQRARTEAIVTAVVHAVLVAASVIVIISLHESIHLVIGRLAGIPAVFTGLTSAGLPKSINPHLYGPMPLALMNGIAPLLTVVFGFVVYDLLQRRPAALGAVRYFFTWWAIYGIPYLGLQLMIVIYHTDYSGNGPDSAALAGYLHLSDPIRAVICLVGFLYYFASALWVLNALRAADLEILPRGSGLALAWWRRLSGIALIIVANGSAVFLASTAFFGQIRGLPLYLGILTWGLGTAALTPWKSSAARTLFQHWLPPGILGMLALIPLGLIGGGNDYASIWLLILPPLTAAIMFATREISGMQPAR